MKSLYFSQYYSQYSSNMISNMIFLMKKASGSDGEQLLVFLERKFAKSARKPLKLRKTCSESSAASCQWNLGHSMALREAATAPYAPGPSEVHSQGLAWRQLPSPANAWLPVATSTWTGPRTLRPGQACLIGWLRSLRVSRWCSGSRGQIGLRLLLATWTGPRLLHLGKSHWSLKIENYEEFACEKKFHEIIYFTEFQCIWFHMWNNRSEITGNPNTSRHCIDYIVFAKKNWQEFFCKFTALANQVPPATCEIYNLLSMSTRYLSLQHTCRSLLIQLELL